LDLPLPNAEWSQTELHAEREDYYADLTLRVRLLFSDLPACLFSKASRELAEKWWAEK
jgi:hypothetical protein